MTILLLTIVVLSNTSTVCKNGLKIINNYIHIGMFCQDGIFVVLPQKRFNCFFHKKIKVTRNCHGLSANPSLPKEIEKLNPGPLILACFIALEITLISFTASSDCLARAPIQQCPWVAGQRPGLPVRPQDSQILKGGWVHVWFKVIKVDRGW